MFKELKNEFKNISSTKNDLRSFGIVMGSFFAIISLFHFLKGRHDLNLWIALSLLFFLAAFLRPQLLLPLQKPWMMLALILGAIMSRVILSILFIFVVVPISFIARVSGKKFLDSEFKKNGESYWNLRTEAEIYKSKEVYEKQF